MMPKSWELRARTCAACCGMLLPAGPGVCGRASLRFDARRSYADTPGPCCAARRLGDDSPRGTDSLLLDYTRLFLGPSHIIAKPYGSVWLDGEETLMQDSTMAVLEMYQRADSRSTRIPRTARSHCSRAGVSLSADLPGK